MGRRSFHAEGFFVQSGGAWFFMVIPLARRETFAHRRIVEWRVQSLCQAQTHWSCWVHWNGFS